MSLRRSNRIAKQNPTMSLKKDQSIQHSIPVTLSLAPTKQKKEKTRKMNDRLPQDSNLKGMKITKENAWSIVRKAQEMGIDPIKIQQKWSILGPSLMNIVAEYKPEER